MPIKKSAFKALRQSQVKANRNQKTKSDVEALIRKLRKAITGKDQNKAADWLKQTIKKLDKAVGKKVVKKNTAARLKSRLSQAVKGITKK